MEAQRRGLQPMLDGLLRSLCSQLHTCEASELGLIAKALVKLRIRGHLPWAMLEGTGCREFLAALDAELAARLPSGEIRPNAVAAVSFTLAVCNWRPSDVLHESLTAWLLAEPKANSDVAQGWGALLRGLAKRAAVLWSWVASAGRPAAAHAVCKSDARLLLQSWVAFALHPGAPARASLPIVQRALAPAFADASDKKGPAGVLAGSITRHLEMAGSVEEVVRIFATVGPLCTVGHMTIALGKLAKLCGPACRSCTD